MKIRVTRRQLALSLAAVLGCTGWLIRKSYFAARTFDPLLPPAESEQPSFEVFLALSKIALARVALDEDLARKMFMKFKAEPWGPKHIQETYVTLRREILRRPAAEAYRIDIAMLNLLDRNQRWFVSHLVTTWYLGIYYHENQSPERVTFKNALMYEAVRDLSPVAFFSNVGFGGWVERPPSVDPEHDR